MNYMQRHEDWIAEQTVVALRTSWKKNTSKMVSRPFWGNCFFWLLIVAFGCLGPSWTVVGEEHVLTFDSFEDYKLHHNKTYLRAFNEERGRQAFAENLRLIDEHNAGNHTFMLRPNSLADLTNSQYLRAYVRLKSSHHRKLAPQQRPDNTTAAHSASSRMNDNEQTLTATATGGNTTNGKSPAPFLAAASTAQLDTNNLPARFDWRDHGFQTAVQNQKSCGACYAFSIAHTVEAQLFRRTGVIVSLSTQQLLDCSTDAGNHGCAGGSLRNTLRYVEQSGGLMRDQDYPYVSAQQQCEYNKQLAVAPITSWAILPAKDELTMQAAIARIGPIAISINASPKTFQLYSHGVYDDAACVATFVNHAMLAVGYTEDTWILKNWWGQRWGDGGYMHIRKGKNMCGLANYVAYAKI